MNTRFSPCRAPVASPPCWHAFTLVALLLTFLSFGFGNAPRAAHAQIISTVAGDGIQGSGGDGGQATAARLRVPLAVTFDSSGNFYISDTQNNSIRKVSSAGVISTVAGNGTEGFSGDGGAATAAQLSNPVGLAFDGAGNLYIADEVNNRIRKVNSAGVISTVAGTGARGFDGDGGQATAAQLSFPTGVIVDGAGNIIIADRGNNRIREVNANGVISTIAGNGNASFGGDGGAATAAQLDTPTGVALDGAGDLYIADANNNLIRKVDTNGIISTFAGNGTGGLSGDGGAATAAQLNNPFSLALDSANNLYIADLGNNVIRKVSRSGAIFTVAGTGTASFGGDGGQATAAQLNSPFGVALDSSDALYIADTRNNRIRKVTNSSVFTPTVQDVAGSGESARTVVVPLSGTDPAGGGLTFSITQLPANGNANIRRDGQGNSALFYRSAAGFSGTDVVKFIAIGSDGGQSAPGTATLTISGNLPPTANNVRGSGASGATIVLPLSGTDPAGGGLTFRITLLPGNGNASIRTDSKGNSALFYRSAAGFDGVDRVRFVATDRTGAQSSTAQATLVIQATARPSANNVSGTVASGQNIVLPLSGTEPGGGNLSYRITGLPRNGNASIRTDGAGKSALFYRSSPGFVGSDSVRFVAIDESGRRSATAVASLNVTAASNSASASGAAQSAPSGGAS